MELNWQTCGNSESQADGKDLTIVPSLFLWNLQPLANVSGLIFTVKSFSF